MCFCTNLWFSWNKGQTTLTTLANFFRHQWTTPQGNPHRDHLIIFIGHDGSRSCIQMNDHTKTTTFAYLERNSSPLDSSYS